VTQGGHKISDMKTNSELITEAQKLVEYIVSIGLNIPARKPPNKHVGGIIADAVLQVVGHQWETQVGPQVNRIREKYPEADTISGLFSLLGTVGAQELMNWKGKDEQNSFRQTITFFMKEKINTFDDLRKWLESEDNRDRLITKSLRNDKAGIANIANRTADYYRILVGLPNAVKVDSRVDDFLKASGIKGLRYEQKRYIVQLAAEMLGKRPIDLDKAIWDYKSGSGSRGDNILEKSKVEGVRMGKNNDKVELKIFLPSEKMGQLESVARQYGDNSATLASIWVIDRLVQMGSAMLPPNGPAKISGLQESKNITDRINKIEDDNNRGLCFSCLADLQRKDYQAKPRNKDDIYVFKQGKPILRIFPLNKSFSVRIRQSDGNWARERIQVHTQEDLAKVLGEVYGIQGDS
jgi:hypothetical protein